MDVVGRTANQNCEVSRFRAPITFLDVIKRESSAIELECHALGLARFQIYFCEALQLFDRSGNAGVRVTYIYFRHFGWAKNLTDVESWPRSSFSGEVTGDKMNLYDMHADYGNTGGTRKHRWITTMVDELPIGKGRFLLGNANGVLNGIVGGWRLSTIFLVETGPFDTPFIQFDSSGNANNGFNRPDLGGNPNNVHHTRTQWWNPNVFSCPGFAPGTGLSNNTLNCSSVVGRFGNAGVGSMVGPGTVNLSLGLAKDFRLTERFKLKFESSFTNLPNHPNFDDPRQNLTECAGSPCLGTFGQVLASRKGDAGGNRVGQLALRIEF